jgi:hypothetical protein
VHKIPFYQTAASDVKLHMLCKTSRLYLLWIKENALGDRVKKRTSASFDNKPIG